MVVVTKMFITSVVVVLAFLVISNAHAGPLSNSLLSQKRDVMAQGDGYNVKRRFVREMNSESLENSESKYSIHNAAFYNYYPYGGRQYVHPGPKAPSFNTHHHGPYSHQYHNQFFNHDHYPHHQPHHFSHDHHPHNFHHHHHHNCDHSNSDSSESLSDETYVNGNNKPYPSLNEKELPMTSAPAKSTEPTPTTTTETTFDIDVRLGSSN